MDDIKETFFQECEELLEELEEGLIALDNGSYDDEQINAMFRAVHSIKGGAGAFALTDLVSLAHKFETTLDEVRSKTLEVTPPLVAVFLRSADALSDLVAAARAGAASTGAPQNAELVAELASYLGAEPEPEDAASSDSEGGDIDDMGFVPITLSFGDDDDDEDDAPSGAPRFDIKFHARSELYTNGNDPALFFRSLEEIGAVEVQCDASPVPDFDTFQPTTAYLNWSLSMDSPEGIAAIDSVFEFALDECECDVTEVAPERSEEPEALPDVAAEPEPVPEPEPAPAASVQPQAAAPQKPADAEKPAAQAAEKKATVRVDLDRVDRLINLVGELVINQAMLSESVYEAGFLKNSSLGTALGELAQLTREIQESVMAIRAQPLKSLFQRMSRIVREAASSTGKNVRLVTEGESTEVDKTVIERLSDPLTHMIRNAVDHGLESTEKRLENGKSEVGVVTLSAAHRSGRVIIEISDDGAGINRERVHQIAVEKGLVPADASLNGAEIDNLLFMPGFSTAKEVSDLSGRGVGMDVVKRSIQALGGRISISSVPQKGSTFSVSLPLTLAVLDGMIVETDGQTVVVPLTSIVETLKPVASEIHGFADGTNVVQVRGHFVPIVDVGHALGYRQNQMEIDQSVFLLIERDDGSRHALAVDRIQDQRQVVIKGLEDNYGNIPGVAAATILGDGRIALILDPDNLVNSAAPSEFDLLATG